MQKRAQAWSRRLWWAVAALIVISTAATFLVSPRPRANFRAYPWAAAFPLLTLAGLVAGFICRRADRDRGAVGSSTFVILGLMGSAASSVYPNLLASTLNPAYSLTIYNAASSPHALRTSLIANLAGMIGVIAYSIYVHRTFRGKVQLKKHGY